MMFGVDLNMSPRQDDDWELEEPEEQEEPDLNWLPDKLECCPKLAMKPNLCSSFLDLRHLCKMDLISILCFFYL